MSTKKKRGRRPRVALEEIIELHNQRLFLSEIARRVGYRSPSTVYNRLAFAGIYGDERPQLEAQQRYAERKRRSGYVANGPLALRTKK